MNTRLATRPAAGGAPSESDREARLAALAARRQPAPTPAPAGRDALDARLAALSARRQPAPTARTQPSRPAGRGKRRHAAHGSRIASLGLSIASTGALAAFFAMSNAGTGNQVQAATIVTTAGTANTVVANTVEAATPAVVDLTIPPVGQTATAQTVTTQPATTQAPTTIATTATPVAQPTIVQGGVYSNKWGEVQVQATFAADGSLLDVVTLQTPSRDGKSVRINDRAVPVLNQEALTIQSADVDTVSGATYTSNDYRRSLQSAIDAAREAGITTLA